MGKGHDCHNPEGNIIGYKINLEVNFVLENTL